MADSICFIAYMNYRFSSFEIYCNCESFHWPADTTVCKDLLSSHLVAKTNKDSSANATGSQRAWKGLTGRWLQLPAWKEPLELFLLPELDCSWCSQLCFCLWFSTKKLYIWFILLHHLLHGVSTTLCIWNEILYFLLNKMKADRERQWGCLTWWMDGYSSPHHNVRNPCSAVWYLLFSSLEKRMKECY